MMVAGAIANGAFIGLLVAIGLAWALGSANTRAGYQMICPYCRKHMRLDSTVCRFCGRDVPRKEMKK